VVTLCGQSTGLLAWAFRDGLGRGGNRSPGKALFGLELAYADGTLVSPMAALCRSSYVLLLPAVSLHPFVGLSLEVLLFFDVATLVLTQDARKAGDYMWGSRVVEEMQEEEGANSQRTLAGSSGYSLSDYDRQHAAANVFSAAMALVFLCLDLMLLFPAALQSPPPPGSPEGAAPSQGAPPPPGSPTCSPPLCGRPA
jgi:hypothetical protein